MNDDGLVIIVRGMKIHAATIKYNAIYYDSDIMSGRGE